MSKPKTEIYRVEAVSDRAPNLMLTFRKVARVERLDTHYRIIDVDGYIRGNVPLTWAIIINPEE